MHRCIVTATACSTRRLAISQDYQQAITPGNYRMHTLVTGTDGLPVPCILANLMLDGCLMELFYIVAVMLAVTRRCAFTSRHTVMRWRGSRTDALLFAVWL